MGGAVDPKTGVTKQQDKFCEAYALNMGNAADAVRQAKFKTTQAARYGLELRRKPNVRRRIAYWEDFYHEQLMVGKDAVLREVATLAKFNTADLYDADGRLIPVHKLPREVAASVQEITHRVQDGDDGDSSVTILVKAGKEKGASLEKLMKHYNSYQDHQESGRGDINVTMSEKDAQL